jgi:hypothetical protein
MVGGGFLRSAGVNSAQTSWRRLCMKALTQPSTSSSLISLSVFCLLPFVSSISSSSAYVAYYCSRVSFPPLPHLRIIPLHKAVTRLSDLHSASSTQLQLWTRRHLIPSVDVEGPLHLADVRAVIERRLQNGEEGRTAQEHCAILVVYVRIKLFLCSFTNKI